MSSTRSRRCWRIRPREPAHVIVLPQIDSIERTPDGVRLRFVVSPASRYFDGHFPGCALLPGVVQIGWAVEFARLEIPLTGRFRALAAVKFTRVITPGSAVSLHLSGSADRRELTFEYRSGDSACSGGRVLFH